MIRPIEPYAIRGVLWYQGESITEGLPLYPVVMEHVITSWRQEWRQGDFPFYFVQLAAQDAASNRPEVREAQARALNLPNTAMAVAMDIGEKKNVHPKNKQDLAERLARIARAKVYGEQIEYSGPVYESMRVEGNSIRVRFTHVGRGLAAKGGEAQVVAGRRRGPEVRRGGGKDRRRLGCGYSARRLGARRCSVCVAPLARRRKPLQSRRPARAAIPV